MRPSNFLTIRLAQIIALVHKHQNLFSKLMTLNDIKDFYAFFNTEVNIFWQEHYTFDTSSKQSKKKLTKSFIDLLIINTIIPMKFVLLQQQSKTYQKGIIEIVTQLKPEKNSIIKKFETLNIVAKNAFESQALIQLKNNYCTPKYCLKCAIGTHILNI